VPHGRVKELERRGDELVRELIGLVNTQYVTPLEREDIVALARSVDDVVDHAEYASDLLYLYRIAEVREPARAQCRILVGATRNVAAALASLRHLGGVERCVQAAKELEDEGDHVFREAIAALFDDADASTRAIVQWRDIHGALEEAVDACDLVANMIAGIAVKNG
jgi:hypothetical protein